MRKSTAELSMHDNFTIYYHYLQIIVENIGRYNILHIYIHLFILIQIILTNTLRFLLKLGGTCYGNQCCIKKNNSKSKLKEHICTKCVKDMVRAE